MKQNQIVNCAQCPFKLVGNRAIVAQKMASINERSGQKMNVTHIIEQLDRFTFSIQMKQNDCYRLHKISPPNKLIFLKILDFCYGSCGLTQNCTKFIF